MWYGESDSTSAVLVHNVYIGIHVGSIAHTVTQTVYSVGLMFYMCVYMHIHVHDVNDDDDVHVHCLLHVYTHMYICIYVHVYICIYLIWWRNWCCSLFR